MDIHVNNKQSKVIFNEITNPISECEKRILNSNKTRIFQPKLITNNQSTKQYDSAYINALREALFTHFEKPYKAPEIPSSISQECDNLHQYICRQCKDYFYHSTSLEDHTSRGSWILGYWCTICFQECEHLAGKKLYCSKCIKLQIQKFKALQSRGFKKNENPGVVRIFFNPCQLLEHMQMHNSEDISVHQLMLLPFPSGIGKEYYPHLKMISEALMDFMFLTNTHIIDWLAQNKIHKWWRMAKGDNPVANIIKKYPFEVQQIKQLLSCNNKVIQTSNSNLNLSNVTVYENEKNNAKDKGKNLNKIKSSVVLPSLKVLNTLSTEKATHIESTDDITFIDCGPCDNENNFNVEKQISKFTNNQQIIKTSNVTENSSSLATTKGKISVKKFAKVPSSSLKSNVTTKMSPIAACVNKVNTTSDQHVVAIHSVKSVNLSTIIKNFPELADKVANKKIVFVRKNLPKDINSANLNRFQNNEDQHLNLFSKEKDPDVQNQNIIRVRKLQQSNLLKRKVENLNTKFKSGQVIKSVIQHSHLNRNKIKAKVIKKTILNAKTAKIDPSTIKLKHTNNTNKLKQKSIDIGNQTPVIKQLVAKNSKFIDQINVANVNSDYNKTKETSDLFLAALKNSTKTILQKFFNENDLMYLIIIKNEKSGKSFLSVMQDKNDQSINDIMIYRNKMFSYLSKMNRSKIYQRINHIKAVSRKYSEKIGGLNDEIVIGHKKFISILENVVMNSDSLNQAVPDDYFGTSISSDNSEKCSICHKITKPIEYLVGFSNMTTDLDYCLCYDFICHKCKIFQGNKERFEAHLRYHNSEIPYACPECNISFTSFQNLNIHIWTDCFHLLIRRILSCNICDISGFCSLESIVHHFVIMHSFKIVACNFCSMVFEYKRFCISHMKKGHSENCNEPLQLTICQLDDNVIPIECYNYHMKNHKCVQESIFYNCNLCTNSKKLFKTKELIKTHIYKSHYSQLSTFIDSETLTKILLMKDIQELVKEQSSEGNSILSNSIMNINLETGNIDNQSESEIIAGDKIESDIHRQELDNKITNAELLQTNKLNMNPDTKNKDESSLNLDLNNDVLLNVINNSKLNDKSNGDLEVYKEKNCENNYFVQPQENNVQLTISTTNDNCSINVLKTQENLISENQENSINKHNDKLLIEDYDESIKTIETTEYVDILENSKDINDKKNDESTEILGTIHDVNLVEENTNALILEKENNIIPRIILDTESDNSRTANEYKSNTEHDNNNLIALQENCTMPIMENSTRHNIDEKNKLEEPIENITVNNTDIEEKQKLSNEERLKHSLTERKIESDHNSQEKDDKIKKLDAVILNDSTDQSSIKEQSSIIFEKKIDSVVENVQCKIIEVETQKNAQYYMNIQKNLEDSALDFTLEIDDNYEIIDRSDFIKNADARIVISQTHDYVSKSKPMENPDNSLLIVTETSNITKNKEFSTPCVNKKEFKGTIVNLEQSSNVCNYESYKQEQVPKENINVNHVDNVESAKTRNESIPKDNESTEISFIKDNCTNVDKNIADLDTGIDKNEFKGNVSQSVFQADSTSESKMIPKVVVHSSVKQNDEIQAEQYEVVEEQEAYDNDCAIEDESSVKKLKSISTMNNDRIENEANAEYSIINKKISQTEQISELIPSCKKHKDADSNTLVNDKLLDDETDFVLSISEKTSKLDQNINKINQINENVSSGDEEIILSFLDIDVNKEYNKVEENIDLTMVKESDKLYQSIGNKQDITKDCLPSNKKVTYSLIEEVSVSDKNINEIREIVAEKNESITMKENSKLDHSFDITDQKVINDNLSKNNIKPIKSIFETISVSDSCINTDNKKIEVTEHDHMKDNLSNSQKITQLTTEKISELDSNTNADNEEVKENNGFVGTTSIEQWSPNVNETNITENVHENIEQQLNKEHNTSHITPELNLDTNHKTIETNNDFLDNTENIDTNHKTVETNNDFLDPESIEQLAECNILQLNSSIVNVHENLDSCKSAKLLSEQDNKSVSDVDNIVDFEEERSNFIMNLNNITDKDIAIELITLPNDNKNSQVKPESMSLLNNENNDYVNTNKLTENEELINKLNDEKIIVSSSYKSNIDNVYKKHISNNFELKSNAEEVLEDITTNETVTSNNKEGAEAQLITCMKITNIEETETSRSSEISSANEFTHHKEQINLHRNVNNILQSSKNVLCSSNESLTSGLSDKNEIVDNFPPLTDSSIHESNKVCEDSNSFDLSISEEHMENLNEFIDGTDDSNTNNVLFNKKEYNNISTIQGVTTCDNYELKNLPLTDDEKINLSKTSTNTKLLSENDNVKRLRSRSNNRLDNSNSVVPKTKRKSKQKTEINKIQIHTERIRRKSKNETNIYTNVSEKKSAKFQKEKGTKIVAKNKLKLKQRKQDDISNSNISLHNKSISLDIKESKLGKRNKKRTRSCSNEDTASTSSQKIKIKESLLTQMPTLRLIKTPAKSSPVTEFSDLSEKVPKLEVVKKYKIGFCSSENTLTNICKFKCHLCGDAINTSWSVVSDHYKKKHAYNYELYAISTKLTRLSDEEASKIRRKIDIKRKSSEMVSTNIKKRKRCSPKKVNEKVLVSADRTSGLFVQLESVIDGEGHFKCKKCDERCINMVELRKHISDNHRIAKRNLICLECGENFVVSPSLQMHLKAFHGIEDPIAYMNKYPDYVLDIEDLEAETKTTVANQCHVCMAVFKDKSSVDKHLRVHGMAFLSRKRREARNAQLTTNRQEKFDNSNSIAVRESRANQDNQRIKSCSTSSSDKSNGGISSS